MSSKGRKKVEDNEFYPTEDWVIGALLESPLIPLPGGTWIEPCAGSGSIIKGVNRRRSDVSWVICEINEYFDQFLQPIRQGLDVILPYGDFVHRDWPMVMADVLIMNPPFSLTMQFVEAAFERASWVVSLQRTNFFGAQERAPWFRRYCPDIYSLPKRASFRPDGKTDSVEYSWFVWPPGVAGYRERRHGIVAMLDMPDGGQQALF